MTLKDMKIKTYSLIEEISDVPELTLDPDLANKFNMVCNEVQRELAQIKKIMKSIVVEFEEGIEYDLNQLENFYLLKTLDLDYDLIETIIKPNETKTTTIYYYVMPIEITRDTLDEHELELAEDVLDIMPFGIASDLLKADISVDYTVYANRYNEMKNAIDTRYSNGTMAFVGGF